MAGVPADIHPAPRHARWFLEGKPFSDCTTETLKAQADAHAAALSAKDEQLTQLNARLAAVPRGGEPVSHSPADTGAKPATGAAREDRFANLGPNLAKVAAAIKLPGKK